MTLILLLACTVNSGTAVNADEEAIRRASMDYIEGYYTGNAEMIARSVHPNWAKRNIRIDRNSGQSTLNEMGALAYYLAAKNGSGTRVPEEEWKSKSKVVVLDIWENMASTKAVMHDYINYLHLAKVDGKWVIVNVLWDTISHHETE